MGLFNTFDISAAGMDVQQLRLTAAASNLANARTSRTAEGLEYRPLAVIVRSAAPFDASLSFATVPAAGALPRPIEAEMVETDAAPRLVYEPGHPDADGRGFVSLPGIDPIASMLDLMEISRSYEANLRAFDVTRSLLQRTLDIGSRR